MSLRQVWSQFFGLPLQHLEAGVSTGSGPTSLQRPTQTYPTDYTYSSISSRTVPSFRTDSSSTSPNSDSDCGMEMQTRETQPCQSLELEEKLNHSTLRHRIKDRGLGGAGAGAGAIGWTTSNTITSESATTKSCVPYSSQQRLPAKIYLVCSFPISLSCLISSKKCSFEWN